MDMCRVPVPLASMALAACVQFAWTPSVLAGAHDALITKHAAENGVPETLVRRVIRIESRGRADIIHKGNYGLMQIRLGTARSLGYSGDGAGLLNPDTNLTYAVKYLAGAYRVAGCDADRAIALYKRGYHGRKRVDCGTVGTAIAGADTDAASSKNSKRDVKLDVIKPRVVQTELISATKAEAVPAPRVAKFEPVRISSIPTVALTPVPLPSPKPAQLMAKAEPAVPAVSPVPVPLPAKPEVAWPPVKLEPAPWPAVAALQTDASDVVAVPPVAAPVPVPLPKPAALTAKAEPDAPPAKPEAGAPAVAALQTDAPEAVPLPRARPELAEAKPVVEAKSKSVRRAERKKRPSKPSPTAVAETKSSGGASAPSASGVSEAVVSFFKKLTTSETPAQTAPVQTAPAKRKAAPARAAAPASSDYLAVSLPQRTN